MLKRQGNQWIVYPYTVTYSNTRTDEDNVTKPATPSKEWWHELGEDHDFITIHSIDSFEPTEEQLQRYEEVKRMPEDFTSVYENYVKDGALPNLDKFPKDHPFRFIVLEKANEKLNEENLNLMLSMTDQYEKNLQQEQDNLNTMLALTDIYEQMNGGV